MKLRCLLACSFAFFLLLNMPTAEAIPPIQEARLDNGLRVLLMEAHNVPMVVMRLTVPAGSRLDPADKGGTASLLAAMLADHTRRHDDQAWADWLDARAIRLGGDAGRDSLSLSVTVLSEALADGVGALAEAALQPGWNKKRFGILQHDAISAARKSLERPGIRAAEETAAMLYPHHGYGHRSSGNMQSLANIGLADLQSLYRGQFRPQGAVLAVSGDVSMQRLLALLRPAFAGWQGRPKASRQSTPKPASPVVVHRHVSMPTRQMTVQLSRLGPSRFDKAFFADMLLNHMLGGGGFSSRLMNEVREKRGLVYGVYSYFMPLQVAGPFVVTLQTRADQAETAEQLVRAVMQKMHAGRISARELAAAKANLTGGFAHRLDSNAKRVGLMSMIGFYDLPLDYLQRWQANIARVRLGEVRAVAERFLDPQQWLGVRVGPATDGKKGAETR